ncbi:hypothetical protein RHMOL_Rhmol04G0279900 [Rhododendron molle]|uniref:Uncharacterized protein n=1 Tax=Rhododendron molle TaxID=49168 RepID=A0ACC0P6T4_RHOML|nr:hypothetical protein RHMOL_Rhmol04G0279900 [Rhododendron molle]
MPWPERVGNSGLMEKMKEVEKDEAVAFGEALKGNGVGKKAWPACSWRVLSVKAKRPEGLNFAMPSRVRFGEALKLLKVKLRWSWAGVEGKRARRRRRRGERAKRGVRNMAVE